MYQENTFHCCIDAGSLFCQTLQQWQAINGFREEVHCGPARWFAPIRCALIKVSWNISLNQLFDECGQLWLSRQGILTSFVASTLQGTEPLLVEKFSMPGVEGKSIPYYKFLQLVGRYKTLPFPITF